MSRPLLAVALGDLLRDDDADHRCVSGALDGSGVAPHPAPVDPELADLAAELRRLRAEDAAAPALLLLSDAAELHPVAVERHLAWLAESPVAPTLVLLDEWHVPLSAAELLQLTA
jgi:hypothetical protein